MNALRGLRSKPLGDLVTFLDHKRRPVREADRKPGPYPYLGANGQQGTIDGYLFDEPLVLLAEDGGHFDQPERGIAYRVSGKVWVNNHAHVLRPGPDLDWAYLGRVLENMDVRPYISGTTRAKLTKGQAEKILIPVLPLAEQRRIAAILDQADALRAKRRAALAQLDEMARAIFVEMFGDPREAFSTGALPTKPYKLGALARIRTGKLDANAADENGKYPFFTCAVDTLRINTAAYDCKAVLIAGNGDLNVKYYEGKFNAYQRTYILECLNEEFIRPLFLYMFCDLYVTELRRQAIGGVIKYIKLPYLTDAVVQVPSIKHQEIFVERLERVRLLERQLAAALEDIEALFRALQYRAFRGEL